ncbi:MAG: hypothetical protein RLZZ511_4436 [Cyanobacteriota bacterium]|jgi:uncharacterized protein (DUF1778 family)
MTTDSAKVTARLEARVKPEIKALWQAAADLQGRSLTDFVIASVQAEATRVIEQHQRLKLNQADSEALIAALLQPPGPNAVLRAAAKRHDQILQP